MTVHLRLDKFRYTEEALAFFAGETIFEQSDPGDTLYIVQEGEVNIIYPNGHVETVSEGGVFGEIAFFNDEPHTTTAYAHTDCRVTPVDERNLLFMIHETPVFARLMLRAMAKRLHRLSSLTHFD